MPSEAVQVGSVSAESVPDVRLTMNRISEVLDANRRRRRLDVSVNGAWQILHGILAYGKQCEVTVDGVERPALDYLMQGGAIQGFDPMRGDLFDVSENSGDNEKRHGLRTELQAGQKIGQGHRDQWFAVLSQCDLDAQTSLVTSEGTFRMDDWTRQVLHDVPRNVESEFSWTLIGLTYYHPTDFQWVARDGETYSIEMLVAAELDQDLSMSACGGTHRLIGMATALNRHRAAKLPMTEVWSVAEERIARAIELAKANQNGDGSFSSSYIHRPGLTSDLAEVLSTTGHTLEFIAIAADEETLLEPWVQRAANRLCRVLELTSDLDLECGALYHALHGLMEYQARLRSAVAGLEATAS